MPSKVSTPRASGFAPANGILVYYEIHGHAAGIPLVVLHGGGSTIDVTWGRILPTLAVGRTVIAIEEQGHGRSTDREEPIAFDTSADDVAAVLTHLDVGEADVFGFSNGANVGLQLALRHPGCVRRLVFASSFTRRDGAHPWFWDFIERTSFDNMPRPLKEAYLRVNPDPAALRAMHDKDAERMRSFRDVPDTLLAGLQAPTLVLIGDRDIVRPEHALELSRLIPDARLMVLPGGHGDYLGEAVAAPVDPAYPGLTGRLVGIFLDEE